MGVSKHLKTIIKFIYDNNQVYDSVESDLLIVFKWQA